jgi:charged multivesicular body protein 2A
LDREKLSLEKEEKRLTIEIKKAAKEQQMSTVKIMAKVCDLLLHTYATMLTEQREQPGVCDSATNLT